MIELWEKSKHPREVVIGFVEHKEERAGGLRAPRLLGRAFDALGWLPRQQFLPQRAVGVELPVAPDGAGSET
jgi:hypothetical protein